jgi:hypothetical protein
VHAAASTSIILSLPSVIIYSGKFAPLNGQHIAYLEFVKD